MDLPMLRHRAESLDKTLTLSLHILQLPLGELEEYLLELSKGNPMLDIHVAEKPLVFEKVPREEWVEEFSWGDRVFFNFSNTWYQEEIVGWSSSAVPPLYQIRQVSKKTFTQHLVEQLRKNPLIPVDFLHHCVFLAESLDSRGYFTEDLAQTAQLLGILESTAEQALYLLQEMEPAGVGARSLKECLLLQLAKSPYFNEYTLELISQDPSCFLPLDFNWMGDLLGVPPSEAITYWQMVRGFNPIPTSGYHIEESQVVPEAILTFEEKKPILIFHHQGRMTVQLDKDLVENMENEKNTILLSYQKLNRDTTCNVIESLDKRNHLLESIINHMVSVQKDFFLKESRPLKPLSIGDLSKVLDVHPTWISRGICDKYIATPLGLLSLKSLLSHKVTEELEPLDRELILSRLRMIVAGEDKSAPLSDAKLQKLLEGFSIFISRRTITKYRGMLEIPNTTQRKKRF